MGKSGIRQRHAFKAGAATVLIGAVLAVAGIAMAPAQATTVVPVDYTGNKTCQDLGYTFGFKIDAQPTNKEYAVSEADSGVEGGGTVTISGAGVVDGVFYFDWASTIAWDAVMVKQAENGTTYVYAPPSSGDTDLHPSTTNGEPTGGISHVNFCRNTPPTTEPPSTEDTTTTTEATTTTTEATTTSETVLGVVINRPAAPAVQGESLPRTGDEDLRLALAGMGLVLLGAGVMAATKERATTTA